MDPVPRDIKIHSVTMHCLEHNAPRRYTCMAMLLAWQAGICYEDVKGELHQLEETISKVFKDTLLSWSMLDGDIHTSPYHAGRLEWTFPMRRSDILEFDRDESPERWEDVSENVHDGYFLYDNDQARLDQGVPPVTLKTTFTKSAIVLGFSIHQSICDTFSFGRFWRDFQDLTFLVDTEHDKLMRGRPDEFQLTMWGPHLHPGLAPFQRGNDQRMVCRRFHFKRERVRDLVLGSSRIVNPHEPEVHISAAEAINAVVTVTMVRAKLQTGQLRLIEGSKVPEIRLDVDISGKGNHAGHEFYVGNLSASMTAVLRSKKLLDVPDMLDKDTLNRACSIAELSDVVGAMRIARTAADPEHLADATLQLGQMTSYIRRAIGARPDHVYTAAETTQEARAAQDGGLCHSIRIEDWSDCGSNTVSLPFVDDTVLQVIPAANYATESKVIVLPLATSVARHADVPVWCCETPEVMGLVEESLRGQGWIN